jgi:hypothetical protein
MKLTPEEETKVQIAVNSEKGKFINNIADPKQYASLYSHHIPKVASGDKYSLSYAEWRPLLAVT